MRAFDPIILEYLKPECGRDPIHFIGLGFFDFQIAVNNVRLQSTEKMKFQIDQFEYVWVEGPSETPVWRLVGQTAKSFELRDNFTLRMSLESGDFLEFVVSEEPYESLIIDFGTQDGKRVVEVY